MSYSTSGEEEVSACREHARDALPAPSTPVAGVSQINEYAARVDGNDVELLRVVGGVATVETPDGAIELHPSQILVRWTRGSHDLIAGSQTRFHWIAVSLAWLLQWRLEQGFFSKLIHQQVVVESSPRAVETFSTLHSELARADEHSPAAELELAALMLRLSRNHSDGASAEPGITQALQMMQTVSQRFKEPLSLELIAAPTRLHPNYASSLFRRVFGIRIMRFVAKVRCAHATRLLRNSHMRVLDIALESGFNSLSQFYQAFQDLNGCTPTQYRDGVRLRDHRPFSSTVS
jgi:AraC-like DNA-binding protein